MEKKSVDFQLSKNLQYSDTKEGDFGETATIRMDAPDMSVFSEFSQLSQLCMRAFADARQNSANLSEEVREKAIAERGEGEPMKPDEIKMALFSSSSVTFDSIANAFKRIACKVCYVSDTEKIKPALFNKMELGDFIGMSCTYIANFITPSLL